MAKETKGKKEPFARLLGINTRTLSRWLDCEVDVSEEYVRNFARTFDIGTSALLIRVGFYQHGELHQAGPTAEEIANDPALQVIEESDHPPSVKARMRQRLYELRAKRAAEEVDEVKWWLDHARGA